MTVALNTIAKVADAARLAATPVTVEPLIDMPNGSLSSAPVLSASSGAEAPAQVVPDSMPPANVVFVGNVSDAVTAVAVDGPGLVISMQYRMVAPGMALGLVALTPSLTMLLTFVTLNMVGVMTSSLWSSTSPKPPWPVAALPLVEDQRNRPNT